MPKRNPLAAIRIVCVVCLAVGLVIWFCGPLLVGGHELTFRDGASYYGPQFHFLSRAWQGGDFPLWNPHENGGLNIAADPTYGIFYPPKILFLLPIQWPLPYHLFLCGHVLLAFLSMFAVLRFQNRSTSAAILGALAYAFSGHVLSQMHNAVYLVSAAWLPIAWWNIECLLCKTINLRNFALASISMAMLILGGDPQTALHLLLLATGFAVIGLWPHTSADSPRTALSTRRSWVSRFRLTGRLMALGAVTLGLSAAQWMPSYSAARQSDRALYEEPRSIWEAYQFRFNDEHQVSQTTIEKKSLVSQKSQVHDENIYHFSVGPWRWLELVWPNVGGRFFPQYTRWFDTIGAEGRVWSLSLYAGLLPLLLAVTLVRFRHGCLRRRRWSYMATVAAFAALGWYGIGWIIRELTIGRSGQDSNGLPAAAGGLYWWFVQVIPGYSWYRYPAKWWTLFAFAMSLLAASGFDGLKKRPRFLMKKLRSVMTISLCGLLIVFFMRSPIQNHLAQFAGDPFFSPLNGPGAIHDLLKAFAHTAVLGGLIWFLVRRARCSIPSLLVVMTVIDLAIANSWIIPSATKTSELENRLIPKSFSGRVYRPSHRLESPHQSPTTASAKRQDAHLKWDRRTEFGKHFLDHANGPSFRGMVGVESAIMPAEMRLVDECYSDIEAGVQPRLDKAVLASLLQVTGRIGMERVHADELNNEPMALVLQPITDSHRFRSAWLISANELLAVTPPKTKHRSTLMAWWIDQLQMPQMPIECPSDYLQKRPTHDTNPWYLKNQKRAAIDELELGLGPILRDVNFIQFDVALQEPAWVILTDRFDAGWTANWHLENSEHEKTRLPIFRAGGMAMAIPLPAGSYRIEMTYRPQSVVWGIAMSSISFIVLCVLLLLKFSVWRRSMKKTKRFGTV